ncbi:hypothetical protein QL285_025580 [Trifolium repens]|jgi:hypothetical protein|nr:hypothetical protein QL285_025580 [Trifolium repens]
MVDNSGRQKKKGSTNNNNVHVSEKKAHNSPAWLNKLVPVYIAFGTCAGGLFIGVTVTCVCINKYYCCNTYNAGKGREKRKEKEEKCELKGRD